MSVSAAALAVADRLDNEAPDFVAARLSRLEQQLYLANRELATLRFRLATGLVGVAMLAATPWLVDIAAAWF